MLYLNFNYHKSNKLYSFPKMGDYSLIATSGIYFFLC